jgi:hypothetical protein
MPLLTELFHFVLMFYKYVAPNGVEIPLDKRKRLK